VIDDEAIRLLEEDMDRRYWLLRQFLVGYLHQNWPDFDSAPEEAVRNAIAEYPNELRRQVARELASLFAECRDDSRLRDVLNWGMRINVHFEKPEDARAFSEDVQQKLIASIGFDS